MRGDNVVISVAYSLIMIAIRLLYSSNKTNMIECFCSNEALFLATHFFASCLFPLPKAIRRVLF